MSNEVGIRLKEIRRKLNMTQAQFNPHFSKEIYCDAKSTHACCAALPSVSSKGDRQEWQLF